MKRMASLVLALLLLGLLPAGARPTSDLGFEGRVTHVVPSGPVRILAADGGQRVLMEGFGSLKDPGKPMLPSRDVLIALPPGARVASVDFEGIGGTLLSGTYRILPAPPMLPVAETPNQRERAARMQREWQENMQAAYSTDDAYPKAIARLTHSGSLRKYAYASVSVCPFRYHALTGRLTVYDAVRIHVRYTVPPPGGDEAEAVEALKWDTVADTRARERFVNYDQVRDLYEPGEPGPARPLDTYDYVIVTTAALESAVSASGFVAWKTSLGYNVRTVLTGDAEIAGQPGVDLAEQIRNFLRGSYGPWGIQYVLLIGDYATVPMRYCFPDPDDHSHNPTSIANPGGSVPTDYYYADLSLPDADSWDSDGDGFLGEYGQDNPDFLAEVFVGRIPTSDTGRITYTLDKLVAFEQDTETWKNQALHPSSIFFFENQDYQGHPKLDGATALNAIQADFMSGWTVSRYSEQEGLEISDFDWPAVSLTAFIDDWRTGQYGVVNWAGHGAPYGVGRTVWDWDDGDGVPETDGSDGISQPWLIHLWCDFEDDYPSIVFAVSCNVGWPEPNGSGNLGIDLLTDSSLGAAAGIVSSSRPAWISGDWPASPGGAESICYEFNRYGVGESETLGEALYDAKHYCHQNYAWTHYGEYINLYNFELYGDPAMVRAADPTIVQSRNPAGVVKPALFLQNHPNPFNPVTEITYVLPSGQPPSRVTLGVYDTVGRLVRTLVDARRPSGASSVIWDGTNHGGVPVASGVYFCRITWNGERETKRMVLLK